MIKFVPACFALLLLLPLVGRAQNQYVYLVKASNCTQAPTLRALSGFRVRGTKGIITALHGVIDSQIITVTSVGGKNGNGRVTIYDVDVSHDLARLSSPALERLPAQGLQPNLTANWKSLDQIKVIGYPLGLDLQDLSTPLTLGMPPIKVLGTLVSAQTRLLLQSRHSPDPSLPVLYLVGSLLPGHSGAPILDRSGHVIAVGDGGLQIFSGIGWAIPWKGFVWTPANKNPQLAALRRVRNASLFASDSDPGAETRIAELQQQLASIKQDTAQIPNIKKNTDRIVALLENELQVKDRQIEFLQGQITAGITPSARAKELAAQIPPTADAYALALKAIAEQRYDDARKLLDQAAQAKETELARIYQARGDTEEYAGHPNDAIVWYKKALLLRPGNFDLSMALGNASSDAGSVKEAKEAFQTALVELTVLDANDVSRHPDPTAKWEPLIAVTLSNLAGLCYYQGNYSEAEPLYQRALAMDNKILGSESLATAYTTNSLAQLYLYQGRYADAEPLLKRSLIIEEKALGENHRKTAVTLENLGELYTAQGKLSEAEALFKRALSIDEKILGPNHPNTGVNLNGLASLYEEQGRYAEAEPLFIRSLDISENSLGPDHPDTATGLECLAEC